MCRVKSKTQRTVPSRNPTENRLLVHRQGNHQDSEVSASLDSGLIEVGWNGDSLVPDET